MKVYVLEETIVKGAHDIEQTTIISDLDKPTVMIEFGYKVDEAKRTDDYKDAKFYCQTCEDEYSFAYWLEGMDNDLEYRLEVKELDVGTQKTPKDYIKSLDKFIENCSDEERGRMLDMGNSIIGIQTPDVSFYTEIYADAENYNNLDMTIKQHIEEVK